jgi:hypothetical protein
MCTVLLPPGVNPVAVNKYIKYLCPDLYVGIGFYFTGWGGGGYIYRNLNLAPPSATHTKTIYISTATVSFDSRSFYEAGDSVCFQDFSKYLKIRRRHFPESTIPYGTTSCLISHHFVLQAC